MAISYIAAADNEGFGVCEFEKMLESLCKTGVVLALIVWGLVIFVF